MNRKLKRTLGALLILVSLGAATFIYRTTQMPTILPLKISKETTYLDSPRMDSGPIDYIAYANQHRQPVDPSLNAAKHLLSYIESSLIMIGREEVLSTMGLEHLINADLDQEEALYPGPKNLSKKEANRLFSQLSEATSRPFTPDEFPLIFEWIQESEDLFQRLIAASQMSSFHVPLFLSKEKPVPFLSAEHSWFNLSEALKPLLCRAYLHIGEGKTTEAIQDGVVLRKVAQLLSGKDDFAYLACLDQQAQVFELFSTIAQSPKASSSLARFILDSLHASKWNLQEARKEALLTKRLQYLDALTHPAHAGMQGSDRTYVDLNKITRTINRYFDAVETAFADETNSTLRHARLLSLQEESREDWFRCKKESTSTLGFLRTFLDPKAMSDSINELLALTLLTGLPLDGFLNGEARYQTRRDLLETGLQLTMFREKHGRLPTSISELVPGFLSNIPIDPYSGQPFVYRVGENSFILYSFGPDRIDNGGAEAEKESNQDGDLLFRMDW